MACENRMHLSDREVEVLLLIARGRTNKEIGCVLHITENTVDSHVRRILARLGARTRAEALYAWFACLLLEGANVVLPRRD